MELWKAGCYAAHVKWHAARPHQAPDVVLELARVCSQDPVAAAAHMGSVFCTVRSASPIQAREQAGDVTCFTGSPQLLMPQGRRGCAEKTAQGRTTPGVGERQDRGKDYTPCHLQDHGHQPSTRLAHRRDLRPIRATRPGATSAIGRRPTPRTVLVSARIRHRSRPLHRVVSGPIPCLQRSATTEGAMDVPGGAGDPRRGTQPRHTA